MAQSQEDFDTIIRGAILRADNIAMESHRTNAEKTRAVVTAALEMLIGNGLVVIAPREEWPSWFIVDPPYEVTLT